MSKTATRFLAGIILVLTWWFVMPQFLGRMVAASAGINDID